MNRAFHRDARLTDSLLKTLSDDEYGALQIALMLRPALGPVIRGGGGLRKVRWGAGGRGKRGGRSRDLLLGRTG